MNLGVCSRRSKLLCVALVSTVAFAACDDDADGDSKADVATVDSLGDALTDADVTDAAPLDTSGNPGSPLFTRGCPQPGKAFVRQLKAGETVDGPAALAAPGDWLIANEHAAFVIKSPTETEHTYGHYGGSLVDALAVNDCTQAAPEKFGEMTMLMGTIDISDFSATTLRTFRGESAEILHDGSDGEPAKLRVWGVDDRFWLVELTLISMAYKAGKPKARSEAFGLKLALDYTLSADRAAIQIDLVAFNHTDKLRELHVGAAAFVDDSTKQQVWSQGNIGAGGFSLRTGLPWLAGSAAEGAIVIAVDAANLGTAQISGVDALVPIDQLATPLKMQPKGTTGSDGTKLDQDKQTFWIGVGRHDSASAVATLEGVSIGGKSWSGFEVAGQVRDLSGAAVDEAHVLLQRRGVSGNFNTLVSERTNASGMFSMRVPNLGKAGDLRLVARKSGRDDSEPVVVGANGKTNFSLELLIGSEGRIEHEIVDGAGAFIPARLLLVKKGGGSLLGFAKGAKGSWAVPPGEYTLHVTRGYEHRPWSTKLTVSANKPAAVKATLPRVIDTSGWMGFDNHVHSQPSPDSTVSLIDRYVSAAAEGLEVVVHSEHEIIVDSSPFLKASGVDKWTRGVAGQEVTASLPEHTNITGLQPDPTHVRGAPVKWHGKDLAEIFALGQARGAGFRALNHPRKGCNWLCLIGWNRQTLKWENTDPTSVGLAKGATMLSWDFEAMEVLNGMDSRLFIDPLKADETGTFEDWMSFWNGGHLIAGLAVTDVHGWAQPGSPRTYFRVPSDDLGAFKEAWLVDAVKAGHVVQSTGAFAEVAIVGGLSDGSDAGPGTIATSAAVEDGKTTLRIKVQALEAIDVARVLVLVNCDTALDLAVPATATGELVKFDALVKVPISVDSHVTVLGFGAKPMPAGMRNLDPEKVPRFITNPIRIDADGDGKWTPPGGRKCMIKAGSSG